MNWLIIDEKYLNYLRAKEKRIPFSDYGQNKYKPFFGVLFETDEFYYVTQILHPQNRHLTMKANEDFKKIYLPDSNRLIAVINLNYMFPIPKSLYQKLEYKDIDKAAIKIYNNKYDRPDSVLAKRCIDFKELEVLALKYSTTTIE